MEPAEILVAGPASWNQLVHLDRLPDPRPHTVFARGHHATVGGTSAGKALNLRWLGRSVQLRTVLGTEAEGARVRRRLESAGVDLVATDAPDGRTERHLNLLDPDGGRVSIYLQAPDAPEQDHGAEAAAEAAALGRAVDAARAVVVDLAVTARPVLEAATARGADVWVDLHDYDGASAFHQPWVDAGTHVFLSSDRMPGYRDFLRSRHDAGARLVVCTHGAGGATALTDVGFVDVPAVRVDQVVDTNGAGDGFFAGFLDAHLGGAGVDAAMRAGAEHAARVVRSPELAPAAR
ncbi:carbohydrate kinase family protein [Isoptericola sp. G70]|uniref:carbohydrate kinase family protein n=1 Tax=Isoptericola sp. G70 TaxID=3376633 RepID=UPI003A80D358